MEKRPIVTAYITKYWLAKGIQVERAELCINVNIEMISLVRPGQYSACFHKGEWFLTMEEAQKRCDELRKKKIKTMEKTLKKLKELKF